MSQFSKKGLREAQKKQEIREQVEHLNAFHQILDQLEEVHQELIKKDAPKVTLDNIRELSTTAMGRKLDWIELRVLGGKLGIDTKILKKNEQEDNTQ